MEERNSKIFGVILIAGIVAVGLAILATRQKSTASSPTIHIGKRYVNEETWDLKYNEDGLVTQVIIHRDATQT